MTVKVADDPTPDAVSSLEMPWDGPKALPLGKVPTGWGLSTGGGVGAKSRNVSLPGGTG
jgi:hypothetical protein